MPAIDLWQACVLAACLMVTLLCSIGMFLVVYRNTMLPRISDMATEPARHASGRQAFGPALQHRIA